MGSAGPAGACQRAALDALEKLLRDYRDYRTNANRLKYRLYREDGLPIASGAVESAHRHVPQARTKRAGQRWALRAARRMAPSARRLPDRRSQALP